MRFVDASTLTPTGTSSAAGRQWLYMMLDREAKDSVIPAIIKVSRKYQFSKIAYIPTYSSQVERNGCYVCTVCSAERNFRVLQLTYPLRTLVCARGHHFQALHGLNRNTQRPHEQLRHLSTEHSTRSSKLCRTRLLSYVTYANVSTKKQTVKSLF